MATGKWWSNGFELDWIRRHGLTGPAVAPAHHLLARLLRSDYPSVAELGGHVYGFGALLALAHDFRVMREDRGYFCLPEIDVQIPYADGMASLIAAKVTPMTARDSMVFGTRYGGADALRAGLVDEISSETQIGQVARALARRHIGKHPPTLRAIKKSLYRSAIRELLAM